MTTLCAGCGVGIEPKAPSVTLSDTDEAMAYAGTDWHPGCFAAVDRAEAPYRAALQHPTDRRKV